MLRLFLFSFFKKNLGYINLEAELGKKNKIPDMVIMDGSALSFFLFLVFLYPNLFF